MMITIMTMIMMMMRMVMTVKRLFTMWTDRVCGEESVRSPAEDQ